MNQKTTDNPPASSPSSGSSKKDSTTEIPMIDLEEAINFISGIHDKGLETVSMPEVAKGMGYGNPTSTPFYRRLTAARHFGLLTSTRAELTLRAKEYLKPTKDNARTEALMEAIMGIRHYSAEVLKLEGKKLNLQFVANVFGKECALSDAAAMICAKVFASSLKTAGFLTGDGLVVHPLLGQTSAPKIETPKDGPEEKQVVPEIVRGSGKTHTLPLNKDGTRVISVTAPLDITEKEIKRIQRWLEVTLLIEWGHEDDKMTT